ncbi:MAG: hypothetical protein ABWY05_11420 [Noviherbaspirillum sp.]
MKAVAAVIDSMQTARIAGIAQECSRNVLIQCGRCGLYPPADRHATRSCYEGFGRIPCVLRRARLAALKSGTDRVWFAGVGSSRQIADGRKVHPYNVILLKNHRVSSRMNNGRKLLGLAVSVFAAVIAIVGIIGLAIYMIMMVIWFNVPAQDVLTLVVPLILIVLVLAWICNKAGIALRRRA